MRGSVLVFGVVTALVCAAALGGQTIRPQVRITHPIDEGQLKMLAGSTHPLARPEFDQGAAPADLPMERMLLMLSRSADQEAALEALLEQQQDRSSSNYHKWLTP